MVINNPKPSDAGELNDRKHNEFQWNAQAVRVYRVDGSGSVSNAYREYITNDIEEPSSTLTYVGKMNSNGSKWLITEIDESSGTTLRYANVSNNGTYTDYSTAWTNRATLTYERIEELTDI